MGDLCKLNPKTKRCGRSKYHIEDTDECIDGPKTPKGKKSCRRIKSKHMITDMGRRVYDDDNTSGGWVDGKGVIWMV